ncbi:type II toxin-antitoxin system HicA family toxin [Pasteurella multocida]|uniref:type II toxin-antitoxin system HicA family toxin n=1 Tax=Pasteurella multocida TaxID=747 RepID=UPI002B466B60|nr:type II toxin-antitoxin system HicA family toxin [Pasteurella multocida]MEB3467504.1 type II toxin-antitoxin system HicA family toxin [Pasteurella multocida]WRK06671.1 type II toxin-antitoxin system HicA family toxin [Pasteurella multocida]HDR1354570.1 type II toxin-antitoxin system HicA family toxin [Pasteurella multocida]
MSRNEKLLQKLNKKPPPKDFTWDELRSLLLSLGFEEKQGVGSRVKFIHQRLAYPVSLHRPHPGNEVKKYVIEQVKDALDELSLG